MRKIPTLFKRDPENMRRVLPEVTPGCEWVLAGEGVPTQKYDGTCVLLDENQKWWARREVKPGKAVPSGWTLVERDGATGKMVGWEPMANSPFAKFHAEALAHPKHEHGLESLEPGTYELCGPKINKNPEGFPVHTLLRHESAAPVVVPRDYDGLREALTSIAFEGIEGVVWHHSDGRMAKLKVRDFASGKRQA